VPGRRGDVRHIEGIRTGAAANAIAGSFGRSLFAGRHPLSLAYTSSAVPEPGTLVLITLAFVPALRRGRDGRQA